MERKDPQVSCADKISSYDQTLLSVVCMAEEALPSRRTSLSTSRSRNRVRLGPIFKRSSSPAATYLSIVERDTRSRSEASRRVIKMSSERRRGKTELMIRLSNQPLTGPTMILVSFGFFGVQCSTGSLLEAVAESPLGLLEVFRTVVSANSRTLAEHGRRFQEISERFFSWVAVSVAPSDHLDVSGESRTSVSRSHREVYKRRISRPSAAR